MHTKPAVLFLLAILLATIVNANNNPLLPGYFADPTIKKFDGVYYIYSTSDGIKLASGQPTVWISYDFENWYNQELDIELPVGLTNCWAPDVVKGADHKYYYYMGNCQFGCNIYGYVSDNPIGPWKPLNEGKPVIPVGSGKEHLPALDAQFLLDDDGSLYSYFGTWCTSFDGVGWVKINSKDMHTIENEGYIPIEQLPHAFEAAYPIKMNDKYILMYSSGDCRLSSYAVHYAHSDSPTGPFTYGENNPILETNADHTIDGPGHHSILKEGNDYYILYHRHDNPHSTGGEFRQVCADKIVFTNDSTIQKIIPTHQGVHLDNKTKHTNTALNASVHASSYYHLVSQATRYTREDVNFEYHPQHATDDNNGTQWKAGSSKLPQSLVVDLGEVQEIKRIMTNFEYPTFYYQYKIEVSENKEQWQPYADRTTNRTAGAPMIDDNDASCRYIKITVTGTEKSGMYAAIWNVKVYNTLLDVPLINNTKVNDGPGALSSNSLLANFEAQNLEHGKLQGKVANKGTLGGNFKVSGKLTVTEKDKRKAVKFMGDGYLELDKDAPASLDWNSSFTVAAWVYVDQIPDGKCIMAWNSRENMLQSSYAALMYGRSNYGAMAHGDGAVDLSFKNIPQAGKWQHIVVTFDGMLENVYVNGELDTQMPLMLFVDADKIRVGASGMPSENFTGYISEARLYDYALTPDEIKKLSTPN
ncbi:MAG: family 43 glycosylhydrolase [Prolixibacteraceae bacterium]|jgi:xylan 1,4-beta-xylosidase|nr:family 43 glycosylhydrolase [Prolixibacteraceae bacterium]